MMMSISDNTASDILLGVVGIDRINARLRACGCNETLVLTNLHDLFDSIAIDLGYTSLAEFRQARAGVLGAEARRISWERARGGICSAFDPMQTNRSTPRDMTRLLRAIFNDEAAPPSSCANLRHVMGQQVSTRLGRYLPDKASLASKTGTFTGWIRNEAGVVRFQDGRSYAAAFFTHSHEMFKGGRAIEREMGRAATAAVNALHAEHP
jgi:beta-lactamase class A